MKFATAVHATTSPARIASGGRFAPVTRTIAAVACFALVAGAGSASADAEGNADHVISAVADIARNLRLTNVPDAIEVEADTLEFDYENGKLAYAGNVSVSHSGVTIRADRVDVSFDAGRSRSLENITAAGSVRVTSGDETAEGERAVYDPGAATVTLTENAKLGSGPNLVTGQRVVVYLDEGRARIEGGPPPAPTRADRGTGEGADAAPEANGRVRVVIMPDSLNGVDLNLPTKSKAQTPKPPPVPAPSAVPPIAPATPGGSPE